MENEALHEAETQNVCNSMRVTSSPSARFTITKIINSRDSKLQKSILTRGNTQTKKLLNIIITTLHNEI